MFVTFRKHQKWLLVVISTVTIASFVVFFAPGQQRGVLSSRQTFGTIYGKPLTLEARQRARHQATVEELIRSGRNRSVRADKDREEVQWLLLDEKIREFGIVVGDDAVGTFLRKNFKDSRTGGFDYDTFIQNVTQQTGLAETEFIEQVRQEIAVQQLIQLVGSTSKLVTPREAEAEFRRDNEHVFSSAVFFTTQDFAPTISVTPDKIGGFYSNRIAAYRLPERTVLNYVRFDAGKHAEEASKEFAKQGAAITNSFEEQYQAKGADAFRDKDDKVLSKSAALTEFVGEIRQKFALKFAREDAIVFYDEMRKSNPVTLDSFTKTAISKGIAVLTTAPFGPNDRVIGLEGVNQLATRAAALDQESPYTEPLISDDFALVAILKQKIPSEIQPLATIRDRVALDYREEEALRAAWQAAQNFQTALTNAATGEKKPLQTLASESNKTVVEIPPFSLAMQEIPNLDQRLEPATLKNRLFGMKKGDSAFLRLREGAAIIQLNDRKPVDDSTVKVALNGFVADLRKQRQGEIFNVWLQSELTKSGLASLLDHSKSTGEE